MHSCCFSVIVPVYNICEEYLNRCIESVIAQEMTDYEIIMIDDGSSAECAARCDAYAARYPQIRLIHQENQGLSGARNTGLKAVRGEWILFLDADDWIDEDAFGKLKPYLDTTACEMVMFDQINERNERSELLRYPIEEKTVYSLDDPDSRERFALLINRREIMSDGTPSAVLCEGWNLLFRADWMREHDLKFRREVRMTEDTLFMFEIFLHMHSFVYIKGIHYHYRLNEASLTHRYKDWIDTDRANLLRYIVPAMHRLNEQIAEMKQDPAYRVIDDECFLFQIDQTMLLLVKKYYDPAYPSPKTRKRDAIRFLKSNPSFAFIYRKIPAGTPTKLRVKVLLLRLGLIDLYCAAAGKHREMVNKQL